METLLTLEDRLLLASLITELRRLNDREEQKGHKDILLSVQQAAHLLGCSRQTVSKKIKEGRLHKVERVGIVGILLSELQGFR